MINVMHFGLGPIGTAVVRQIADHGGFKVVGGIDVDPEKVGRDVGEVAGLSRKLRAQVWNDAPAALEKVTPDVIVLCTSSSLKRVFPQIEIALQAGIPVISTTEELAYPAPANRAIIATIDALAKKANVAVLGTGVNPGFVMDTLPITLTGPCERVDAIRVERVQDATTRRFPFQKKIGCGLTVEQFQEKVVDGSVRHVGMAESIYMIGDALGWEVDRVLDEVTPKIAESRVSSEFFTIVPGQVRGLRQIGIGYVDGKPLITLHMEAYLGARESFDAVHIDGSPKLSVKVIGGTHGDIATAAIVVNSIPKLLRAAPGYRTMRDMPIPSFFRGLRAA